MVNKFKKASIRKQQTLNHPEAYKIIEKDVMEGEYLVKLFYKFTFVFYISEIDVVHICTCYISDWFIRADF